jgi:hypothetical protein
LGEEPPDDDESKPSERERETKKASSGIPRGLRKEMGLREDDRSEGKCEELKARADQDIDDLRKEKVADLNGKPSRPNQKGEGQG